MAWETFWALVLGFGISGALQTFVSREQVGRFFGQANLRSVALATALGAASSSCSYAAAAAARSALRQGAALVPALAFMFASTNLVVELAAVLWIYLGWRFVLAEAVGAVVLIALMWLIVRFALPSNVETEAQSHAGADEDGDEGECAHHCHEHQQIEDRSGKWQRLASAFVMDWQMLWKEIVVGFLIAGFLSALVPANWWESLFLKSAAPPVRLLENAVVGALIAAASFVCSVGNIPMASVLWSGGISFGGVISFIYADLIVVPLLVIYRKYYGMRAAAYIAGALFLSMVGAGILVDALFSICGLIPGGPRPPSLATHAHFAWNYTTWLDVLAAMVTFTAFFTLRHRAKS